MIGKYIYKAYIVCLFLLLATVAKTNASTTFTKGAKVSEVIQNWEFNDNHEFIQTDDTITVTLIGGKNDGQMYSIDTPKGIYTVNDIVEVHMNDNGTLERYTDDTIVEIRKVDK